LDEFSRIFIRGVFIGNDRRVRDALGVGYHTFAYDTLVGKRINKEEIMW